MNLECRPVDGFDGWYAVSKDGDVWSFKKARWLKSSPRSREKRAYPAVVLSAVGQKSRSHSVHILVAKAWVPNPHGKPHVNHIDGNKLNFRHDNLEWVTCAENHRHAFATGLRKNKITKAGLAAMLNSAKKLAYDARRRAYSAGDVRIIKGLREAQFTQRQIAGVMGGTQSQVSRILSNENYRWTTT